MLYVFFLLILHIPLTLTQRKIDAHFCRFLTVSLIGGKFPLTAAPRTQYTVKGKTLEILYNFLVMAHLLRLSLFTRQERILDFFLNMY
jgi:hypothetical protein